ncbi:MAG: NAD(+)/NADH kinase [Actinomycetota bacterium]|jgi:NAD+ kinase|nr:NAD(+)/NADH kinase [Actinomycetota bacterium]
MAAVALLLHHRRAQAVEAARSAAAWLGERGHSVRLPEADAVHAGLAELACDDDGLTTDLDLAVSLGGDGTMLRTVDLVADDQVPVVGVNLGHLGYLAEVEAHDLHAALERFFAGEHEIQERMRLRVEVGGGAHDVRARTSYPALNEAVLSKTPSGQIVSVKVYVDGEDFTTYRADGIIVATPTGSTAYAWSAGGPIVAPSHAALLLTPVAPHTVFDRSLVLPPTATIRLEITADRPASLSIDGRNQHLLAPGDAVVCTAAEHPARVVTFGRRGFLGILKAKFGLNDTG